VYSLIVSINASRLASVGTNQSPNRQRGSLRDQSHDLLNHRVSSEFLIRRCLQTTSDKCYQYLTGPRFRHRVEAFSTMQEDLDKERKAITKQRAKREAQIERVMNATVDMYGDLQGFAGKSLQEIEGLEMRALGMHGKFRQPDL
jgi:hypothetical protein